MFPVKLNDEWCELMDQYKADHQDRRNQRCHSIGIPMILVSIPVGATIIGLPVAIPLFAVGWGFQFVGHIFEGKKPSFTQDRRQLLIGALWWSQKVGLSTIKKSDRQ